MEKLTVRKVESHHPRAVFRSRSWQSYVLAGFLKKSLLLPLNRDINNNIAEAA